MRYRMSEVCVAVLVGGAVMASLATGATAADTFLCADGRTLRVDDSNRARLADDPCIKDWFTKSAAKRTPLAVDREAALLRPPEQTTVHVRKYNKARKTMLDSTQR